MLPYTLPYMIHECSDAHIKYDYKDNLLTFDDALYTQYKYLDFWRSLPNKKILFVTPTILCDNDQNTTYITASDAHNHYFETGSANYHMTIDQIRACMDAGFEIGIHGYDHTKLSDAGGLHNMKNYLDSQIQQSVLWFNDVLNLNPKYYCHPYNDNHCALDFYVMAEYNLKIFGRDRINLRVNDG